MPDLSSVSFLNISNVLFWAKSLSDKKVAPEAPSFLFVLISTSNGKYLSVAFATVPSLNITSSILPLYTFPSGTRNNSPSSLRT
jgi:hypothetical protein